MDTMKSVNNIGELSADKLYAIQVTTGSEVKELANFIGLSETGAAFKILPSLVRQNIAMQGVTIRGRAVPANVFELQGEA